MNIYLGFMFDGKTCVHLIATTDYDKCKNHLLKDMEKRDGDYDYWIEVWANEKLIHDLLYDNDSKRFVDLINF